MLTPEQMRLALTQVAGFIDNPIADVLVTPEETETSPRTITIQVRDRLNVNWKGRWWVRVAFGSTEWERDGSLTITITSAAISIPIVADQVYDLLTNSDGTATLTIDGADDTYYLTSTVLGRAQSSSVEIASTFVGAGEPIGLLLALTKP